MGLVEVACFFSFLGFFVEAEDFIDDFDVAEQHASATVSFDAEAVQYVAGVLARLDAAGELVPLVTDEFAAGETSYRDNHSFFAYL
jgi:hypothetical protein